MKYSSGLILNIEDFYMQLEGMTAIVIGSGIDVGRAIASRFAQEDADVVVAARSEQELNDVAKVIKVMGRKSLTRASGPRQDGKTG